MAVLEVDGCRLHVQEAGQGPGVLLVHGTAANLWGELPGLLAADHRVVSYDRRSFGHSSNPPLASLRRHTQDAARILECGTGGPSVVVGWSIGGVIALDLAATRPELVTAVVVIEAPLFAKRRPRPDQLRGIVGAKFQDARGRQREGAERFLRWALQRRGEDNDLDRLPAPLREAMLANAAAKLREIDAGTGERELSAEVLARLRCPIRWLYGDLSARSFAAAAHRARTHLPQVTIVPVQRSGHLMQYDRPDAVVQAVHHLANNAQT